MRTRIRTHFGCDFCKKVTHTRKSMEKHEASCTANPGRVCKMCRMAGLTPKPISDLHRIISRSTDSDNKEREAREYVSNCPACLLAGIRQFPISADENGGLFGPRFSVAWKEEARLWLDTHGKPRGEDWM